MSRTMTSRPICTPCAGSGIDPFALPFGNELPDFIATIDDIECLSCGGTGYDPKLSACNDHPLILVTEDYA